jgi:hypothetical protein
MTLWVTQLMALLLSLSAAARFSTHDSRGPVYTFNAVHFRTTVAKGSGDSLTWAIR